METIETYVERHRLRDVLSDELIATLKLVAKEPGELLVRAGDPADWLYFFVEGRIKAYSTLENGQSVPCGLLQAFRRDRRG